VLERNNFDGDIMITRRLLQLLPLALVAGLALGGTARADGDATHGKQVFQQCGICHSTEPGEQKLGPTLHGVIGRKAASVPGFRYTPGMQKVDVTWTPEQLDKWLSDPSKMAPGTAMAFNLTNEKDRQDVIAYMATLK
jgi:cytochrome c